MRLIRNPHRRSEMDYLIIGVFSSLWAIAATDPGANRYLSRPLL